MPNSEQWKEPNHSDLSCLISAAEQGLRPSRTVLLALSLAGYDTTAIYNFHARKSMFRKEMTHA